MKELVEIARAWDELLAERQDGVLATVVAVSGSAYRRPGARMLMSAEGRLAGSVSGGCLEGDLVKKAAWQTRNGPAVVTYDSTDDDDIVWGFGLGCRGVVQVLLERVSAASPGPLNLVRAVPAEGRPGVTATVIGGASCADVGERLLLFPDGQVETNSRDRGLAARVLDEARAVLSQGESRTITCMCENDQSITLFCECVLPPLSLVVFGGGHDVPPLLRIAKEMGWATVVVDSRDSQPRPERFPDADLVHAGDLRSVIEGLGLNSRAAAVIMNHSYPRDLEVLKYLLQSPVGYIGQLGPCVRTERMLAELRDSGISISAEQKDRLHAPVGLDLGADTPEGIALAIVAEISAWHKARPGGMLREKAVQDGNRIEQ